jgi:hypothetical protein
VLDKEGHVIGAEEMTNLPEKKILKRRKKGTHLTGCMKASNEQYIFPLREHA